MGCSEICHKLIVWLPVALDLPRLWLSIYGPSIKAYRGNTLQSWTDLCVIINVNFMVRLQFELKITTRLKPWIFEINWCSQTKPICIWYLVIHTNCTNLVWEKIISNYNFINGLLPVELIKFRLTSGVLLYFYSIYELYYVQSYTDLFYCVLWSWEFILQPV